LRPAAETQIRAGHPWIFSDSIREQNRDATTGELAVVFDRNDNFLAIGLYDADSPIRVRVIHRGKPVTIDSNWWRSRLKESMQRRAEVADSETNGLRWINGESDFFAVGGVDIAGEGFAVQDVGIIEEIGPHEGAGLGENFAAGGALGIDGLGEGAIRAEDRKGVLVGGGVGDGMHIFQELDGGAGSDVIGAGAASAAGEGNAVGGEAGALAPQAPGSMKHLADAFEPGDAPVGPPPSRDALSHTGRHEPSKPPPTDAPRKDALGNLERHL
jgi:hypothetical protein